MLHRRVGVNRAKARSLVKPIHLHIPHCGCGEAEGGLMRDRALARSLHMSSKPLIIAIDGPSGAGKGTLARAVADALKYRHIDTGAMYRAVAWKALHDGLP